MKLYMSESSGNAYKPRLLLEMLKVPYEKVIVDTQKKEHKQAPFLALNPRGQVPVLFTAGRTPINEDTLKGHRTLDIHWTQEMYDQAAMVRESVKWDYELRNGEQLETIVDRMLTVAMSDPKGPVYLSLPREVLSAKLDTFT